MNAMTAVRAQPGLGTGIYTIGEAARLLKVGPARLRGWANGYRKQRSGTLHVSDAVLDRAGAEPGLATGEG